MLELPEIETLRRETEREIGGRKLKSVSVDKTHLAEGSKAADLKRTEGAKVGTVKRRGSCLVMNLDSGDRILIDVSEGVALRKAKGDEASWAEFGFTQGAPLRVLAEVGDPRVGLLTAAELEEALPPSGAIDLTEHAVSWVSFARVFVGAGGLLRTLLTDPGVIDGIGPMYADEILWQAGLRADRRAEKLGSQELRRLYRATAEVLHDALKAGGTTTSANGFTDLAGKPGGYQESLEVWGRDGHPCRRCRGTVVVEKFEGQPSYRCAQCQI
jgi:formamidopyrimidine-DNA glycosylase